jgi:hypothetical protein
MAHAINSGGAPAGSAACGFEEIRGQVYPECERTNRQARIEPVDEIERAQREA